MWFAYESMSRATRDYSQRRRSLQAPLHRFPFYTVPEGLHPTLLPPIHTSLLPAAFSMQYLPYV